MIAAAEAAKQAYRRDKRMGRITNEPDFLDLVDLIGRGGTADWQELYARAKASASLRAEIRDALRLVDPELGSARELWARLLDQMEVGE